MAKSKKPCSVPGCPNVTPTGKCTSCRAVSESQRGTSRERGYDSRWNRTRRDFLEEFLLCSEASCLKLATDVDHIDGLGPLSPRGHDKSNLRGYCHAHHSQRTARDQPGGWNRR